MSYTSARIEEFSLSYFLKQTKLKCMSPCGMLIPKWDVRKHVVPFQPMMKILENARIILFITFIYNI